MTNLQRPLLNSVYARRREMLPMIFNLTGGKVQTGPFIGQTILPEYSWGDGDTASKLLGLYENELHTSIGQAIESLPDLVINVGCAEGYYAVGAKVLTGAKTIAVDTSARALQICQANAAANNITIDQLLPSIAPAELIALVADAVRPWLIMDCEGYEDQLLADADPLRHCAILAETHDVFNPGLTDRISNRFSHTHNVVKIDQTVKNTYQFAFLRYYWDSDKAALVDEGRPESGTWVWMMPR